MEGCVQYAVYAVYGYKHRGAAKRDGDLSVGLVGKLGDLLQHLGRQNVKGVVLVGGKDAEPLIESAVESMFLSTLLQVLT